LEKAKKFRAENTSYADNLNDFQSILDEKGGFIYAHWDGSAETENRIKEMTKATIRCIPNDSIEENGKCILSGKPSKRRVLFAKAY
jgi:prolyl-tRNA synthetase